MLWAIFRNELRIALRQHGGLANPLWFFVMVIALFPLAIGPSPQMLARMGPGVIWVAALLAMILALERLFRDDLQDGWLEQLLLLPLPLPWVVTVKVLAHWAMTGIPLLAFSLLGSLLMGMDFVSWQMMALTLALGTPTLTVIGAIGLALTIGLQRGGVLLSLLVLPLAVPVVILATLTIDAASGGHPVGGHLAILGALLVGSLTLGPFAIAAALRISLQ